MHTYHDEPSGIRFHFDAGLETGDLRIVIVEDRSEAEVDRYPGGATVTLPVEAILRLVAYEHVAAKRISAIEGADYKELLA